MADAQGHAPKPSLGMELLAGHVHRDHYGRSPAPALSHRPVRHKRKSVSVSSHASNPERPNIPERVGRLELPRLRVLEAQGAAIPISSSAASSASPRSGSSRVHPYPVGRSLRVLHMNLSLQRLPKLLNRGFMRKGRVKSSSPPPGLGPQDNNWKKGKDPHPQDKIQHLDFTKRPLAALPQDPSLCILPQKCPQ